MKTRSRNLLSILAMMAGELPDIKPRPLCYGKWDELGKKRRRKKAADRKRAHAKAVAWKGAGK